MFLFSLTSFQVSIAEAEEVSANVLTRVCAPRILVCARCCYDTLEPWLSVAVCYQPVKDITSWEDNAAHSYVRPGKNTGRL